MSYREIHYFEDQSFDDWTADGTDWSFTANGQQETYALTHDSSNFSKIGSHPDTQALQYYPDAGSTMSWLIYSSDISASTWVGGWADSDSSVNNLHIKHDWTDDDFEIREEIAGSESTVNSFSNVGYTADTWYYVELRHYDGSFYGGTANETSAGLWEFSGDLNNPKGTLVAGGHGTTFSCNSTHSDAGHNGVFLWASGSGTNLLERIDWLAIESGNVVRGRVDLSASGLGSGLSANDLTETRNPVAVGLGSGAGVTTYNRARTPQVSGSALGASSVTYNRARTPVIVGQGSGSAIVTYSRAKTPVVSGLGSGSGAITLSEAMEIVAGGEASGSGQVDLTIIDGTLEAIGSASGIGSATITTEKPLVVSGSGKMDASAIRTREKSMEVNNSRGVGEGDAFIRIGASPLIGLIRVKLEW